MAETNIDEIVDFPLKALQKIGTDATIIRLLLNDPTVDPDSDEADSVFDKYLFDYEYVDETTVETAAYICVESEVVKTLSATMDSMSLYVTVVCHRNFMDIDHDKFPGMAGCRRENLIRYIDKAIGGSGVFGVGKLRLQSIKTIPAPAGFVAREMCYDVPIFDHEAVR